MFGLGPDDELALMKIDSKAIDRPDLLSLCSMNLHQFEVDRCVHTSDTYKVNEVQADNRPKQCQQSNEDWYHLANLIQKYTYN